MNVMDYAEGFFEDAEYAKDMEEADRAGKALEGGYDADKAALKAKEDAEFDARYGGYDQAAEDERSGGGEGAGVLARLWDSFAEINASL